MANVWKKLRINKTTVANCEIMADRVESKYDKDYWLKSAGFLNNISEFDYAQLSKGQKDYALKIKLDLQSEGLFS